jgi:shikimate 5-dehydrogenase
MRPTNRAPVRLDRLTPRQLAADVVTRPEVTPFLAHSEALDCKVMRGLAMFRAQEGLLVDFLLGKQESTTTRREETHS